MSSREGGNRLARVEGGRVAHQIDETLVPIEGFCVPDEGAVVLVKGIEEDIVLLGNQHGRNADSESLGMNDPLLADFSGEKFASVNILPLGIEGVVDLGDVRPAIPHFARGRSISEMNQFFQAGKRQMSGSVKDAVALRIPTTAEEFCAHRVAGRTAFIVDAVDPHSLRTGRQKSLANHAVVDLNQYFKNPTQALFSSGLQQRFRSRKP